MRRILFIAIIAAFATAGCTTADGNLPRARQNATVKVAVDSFINATTAEITEPEFLELHSIMLVQHGKVLEERWINGAAPDIPHVMYSVSKTFTAMAAGLAVDDGLLSVDDKVTEIFPDKLPAEVSDNLAAMTIKDLMTMTCGQEKETAAIADPGSDWVEDILAEPVVNIPGTDFTYNSLTTYMVSAAVQKVTGQKVVDYLDARVFRPLGIEKPRWDESPQGINCGGWGLFLKTEDMAKAGQLLLNGGKWNGQQLISEEWVKEMTSFKVPNNLKGDPRPDWTQGYCYYMWRCTHNGVRADGKDGQYIILLPEKDAVIALTAYSDQYQKYLDLVWKYIYPAL